MLFFLKRPALRPGKRGHTLIELLTVLAIGIFLLSIALPRFSSSAEDVHFRAFASELTGHLVLARHQAQVNQTSTAIDFSETEDWRFACFLQTRDGWTLLRFSPRSEGYRGRIRNSLPPFAMEHPTQNKMLDKALRSTHAPRIVFAPGGSSNATIVFSDGKDRALCAVVSGQTGRFRVFIKTPKHSGWRIFF